MKVSRQQVAENRRKILETAGKLFREKGFEAVSVADIMAGAGLTHGGFYGYFKSKDDLIAQALQETASSLTGGGLDDMAERYLSCAHKDNPGTGCAVAALGADIARMPPEARAAITEVLKSQIRNFAAVAKGETPQARRQAAIGAYAALVGGLTLARMSPDEALSREILEATRAFVAAKP